MTAGVLFIAKNGGAIDYLKIAEWNAARVRKYLDLPVTIITDADVEIPGATVVKSTITPLTESVRIFADAGRTAWKNSARWEAYALSPYDETLLLDVDYVVSSDVLLDLLNSAEDLLAFKTAYDLAGATRFDELNTFGQVKMPMFWATVMYFRKSPFAESVFEMMEMVERNYAHYAELYKFESKPYRNDYALSISLLTLYGHTSANIPSIPWQLATATPDSEVRAVKDGFSLHYTQNTKLGRVLAQGLDIHVMGKTYLEEIAGD